jgi:hypothetical protein
MIEINDITWMKIGIRYKKSVYGEGGQAAAL